MFEEYIEYAKEIIEVRDAMLSGEFYPYGYIKHIPFTDCDKYRYTLPTKDKPILLRVNQYELDMVSSFQKIDREMHFIHHTNANKIWLSETDEYILASDIQCTEEFYFQNTLLYSDDTMRELIVFAYCMEHPMPEPYKYFKMNVHYLSTMRSILNRMRDINESI